MATIANDNLVDNVFNPRAVGSDHGHERNTVFQALLDEAIKQSLIRYRNVQNQLAGERHRRIVASRMTARHRLYPSAFYGFTT